MEIKRTQYITVFIVEIKASIFKVENILIKKILFSYSIVIFLQFDCVIFSSSVIFHIFNNSVNIIILRDEGRKIWHFIEIIVNNQMMPPD